MIEQDLYWVIFYKRWVMDKGKDVTKYFAPMFPSLPTNVEAFIITHLLSGFVGKQAYAQGMGRHSWYIHTLTHTVHCHTVSFSF